MSPGVMLFHRSPGYLSPASLRREKTECDRSGGLPLIARFSRLCSPLPVSLQNGGTLILVNSGHPLPEPLRYFPNSLVFPATSLKYNPRRKWKFPSRMLSYFITVKPASYAFPTLRSPGRSHLPGGWHQQHPHPR